LCYNFAMTRPSTNGPGPAARRQASGRRQTDAYVPETPLRTAVAFFLPLTVALVVAWLTGAQVSRQAAMTLVYAPVFAALGLSSWLLGLRWYGLPGMGLRGRRPLFASIGFAVLGWVALLIARLLPAIPSATFTATGQAIVEVNLLVEVVAIGADQAGRVFLYLLLFEAFALQLWTFGTLFRALSDWRGPLTAAVSSGLLFGAAGFLLFREAFVAQWSSLLFFVLWGVLYGIIRLRTGSLLGLTLVQALQSFTVWYVFLPPEPPPPDGLQSVYLVAGILYALIIWRLWPRREEDYRV
jgi:hypothetical protein